MRWVMLMLLVGSRVVAADAEHGASPAFDKAAALKVSQAALGRQLGDYRLVAASGQTMTTKDFLGKPLVINLVYTSCYHTCLLLTSHLAKTVKIARAALGEQSFALLTIGFDTLNDTPQRMADYARERNIDLPGWRFVSVDSATIAALTRDLGFLYASSPRGFDHLIQTTVVDANGRIYRQVYGQDFAPTALVEPLKQLVFGTRADATTLAGWINGLRLWCTVYDANSGRYIFDYSIFIALFAGMASAAAIAAFIVHAWRNSKPA